MENLNSFKIKIAAMAKIALRMWQLTYRGFMEHDLELLAEALKEETKLNDLEKELTSGLVELSRDPKLNKQTKTDIGVYTDVVADLELIGDYCKDILERIEIKIQEKLLFSDVAVQEYGQLYRKTEEALEEVTLALDKDNLCLLQDVLRNQEHIDNLVDEYRRRHNQRLVEGLCSPFACNMFLNMLDFTAAVYYHTKKIVKNLLKVK
jgi:phosphate:Na+ symporter